LAAGSASRRAARDLLVQALYQWQLTGASYDELVGQFEARDEFARSDERYFRELLRVVVDDAEALDRIIVEHAVRSLEQLDAVGRAVLLLALGELTRRADVPTKVIINEAVDLAKRYGAADSYRFVNAVLDKAAKQTRH
jgi:transcription antitermination protein NusB